jgi:SEC-C motif-containing protein
MADSKPANSASSACPCGSKRSYRQCCELLHNGVTAGDAEALMRSRYSAFALGLEHYIQRSWHVSTRPAPSPVDEQQRWIGLQIKRYQPLDSTHALVEFIARYKINGRGFALHEISRFVREGGHWFYVDGEILR